MDEAAKAQQEMHIRARTVLTIHAITTAQPGTYPFRQKLRPHTRMWLRLEENKIKPLGIIFNRWDDVFGGITFTQKGIEGAVIRKGRGQFANDRNGQELGLIVDKRWIWDDLVRTYKGLAHGNY
jgi:hypothetical protein